MGHSGGSLEEHVIYRSEDSKDGANKFSGRNREFKRKLSGGHVWYILVRNLCTFCPGPGNLKLI